MNTNQESPGINSWWHSDSPAYNWSQKVELEFDIKQKSTVGVFQMVWGTHLSDKCDTRGKSKMLVISDDMFTKVFMRNRSVYRHVAISEQFVRAVVWKTKTRRK